MIGAPLFIISNGARHRPVPGAGQGVGEIRDVVPVVEVVASLRAEYEAARTGVPRLR